MVKFTGEMRNEGKIIFPVYAIFSFSDIVDFVLKFRRRKIIFGGLRPLKPPAFVGSFTSQALDVFELNPPRQLVLEHHWLAFLNQVYGLKNLSFG